MGYGVPSFTIYAFRRENHEQPEQPEQPESEQPEPEQAEPAEPEQQPESKQAEQSEPEQAEPPGQFLIIRSIMRKSRHPKMDVGFFISVLPLL